MHITNLYLHPPSPNLVLLKKNLNLINGQIRAKEVILIDENGTKKGLTSIDDALQYAQNLNLDLVQVSPKDRYQLYVKF